MTLTLMAPYEDDEPESVFPVTEKVLFLGGPFHAQDVEVPTDEQTWKMFVRPKTVVAVDNGPPLLGSGTMQIQTYYRRPLHGQNDDGEYVRDVFIHESVPSPQVAQQLLMAALLTRFITGGRRVVEGDVTS